MTVTPWDPTDQMEPRGMCLYKERKKVQMQQCVLSASLFLREHSLDRNYLEI